MTVISKSVTINAPVAQVQAFMDNPDITPEWYEGMETLTPSLGYPTEVGSTAVIEIKAGGMTMESNLEVAESEPEKLRVFKMDGMITGTNRWTIRPDGDVTHIDLTIDYEIKGGGIGKIMDKLFVERINDKNAEASLTNLKNRLEA